MVITCSKSMDQPGKVANSTRGQLNREKINVPLSPYVPENLLPWVVVRDDLHRPTDSRAVSPYRNECMDVLIV